MSSLGPGWHAFSPDDPDCPPELRELYQADQRPVLGTVTVTVRDLARGGSSIRAGGPGATTLQLIDAAIAELQENRRHFMEDGPITPGG
ncbi:hypothetical protein [Kineococcus glutinatus]|uniref:Uncharacterized protein n=1 Tax=Kineococcus glutinatus TaxID=1070872 RepID=A0ABP8VAJ7_9ACTN